jgi:hypothetical protein
VLQTYINYIYLYLHRILSEFFYGIPFKNPGSATASEHGCELLRFVRQWTDGRDRFVSYAQVKRWTFNDIEVGGEAWHLLQKIRKKWRVGTWQLLNQLWLCSDPTEDQGGMKRSSWNSEEELFCGNQATSFHKETALLYSVLPGDLRIRTEVLCYNSSTYILSSWHANSL